jgi:hypothetical protein
LKQAESSPNFSAAASNLGRKRENVRIGKSSVWLVGLWPAGAALAGTFDVKAPEITKGETELATNHSLQAGFPANADRVRYSWEAFLGYGFSDSFKAGIKGSFDRSDSESMIWSTASLETQVYLGKLAPAVAWAWYTEVAVAIDRDETNTAIFGPLLQLGNDKAALTLNLLFEQTFGQNREDGTTLAYAAGLKRELKEGIAIGIESHGRIPNIAEAPGIDWQEHRIGPVLYHENDVGSQSGAAKGGKLSIEIGAFAGMTEATPDLTGKIKAALTW